MINSRDIKELLPVVRAKVEKFQDLCEEHGIDLLITSTFRDAESQAALYAQGRTAPGTIVTNAKPGQSWHNHRCAIDVVPLVSGKANWNTKDPVWEKLGGLGKEAGLEWAGEWKKFKEMAHFQYTGGLTLAELQAGGKVV
jgi:peptidoglycan L-alanyl-D-glutamate endopeptidase CwlK